MTKVLETDDRGTLHLTAEVLGNAAPRARFVVESLGEGVLVRRDDPVATSRTLEERVKALIAWMDQPRPAHPSVPLESLRRENLY